MKDCCWENLKKAKRLGRAKFVCPVCGEDVTMALVFYEQTKLCK